MTPPRDPSLDTLLDVDGQVLVVDPDGAHWVRFVVTRVATSPEKPRGLDDEFTLHGPKLERLVGFDVIVPLGPPGRAAEAGRPAGPSPSAEDHPAL